MTGPGGDELRTRAYLRRLGARPLGHHQEPTMPTPDPDPAPRPVTPTRIIPAGAPLPARAPAPGETPPWRTPPPPPPPAVPEPPPAAPAPEPRPRVATVRHVHVHEVLLVAPEPAPEEEPPGLLARAWDWLCDWRLATAVGAAVTPWMAGHSPVSAWAHTLATCRTEASTGAAYVLAGAALAGTWALNRTNRWVPRALFVTALIGSTGAMSWFDPITALTGVHL